MNNIIDRKIIEKELIENGMTIKTMKKAPITLTASTQEVFATASVLKLQELHEKFNDDFICNDGYIKTVVTV